MSKLFNPNADQQIMGWRVRPPRVVILVDNRDEGWKQTALRVIEWCCRYWGGSGFIAIPTDGSTVDPEHWNTLRGYDPDYIMSYSYTFADIEEQDDEEFAALVEAEFKQYVEKYGKPQDSQPTMRELIENELRRSSRRVFKITDDLNSQLCDRLNPFYLPKYPRTVVGGFVSSSTKGRYRLKSMSEINLNQTWPYKAMNPIYRELDLEEELLASTYLGRASNSSDYNDFEAFHIYESELTGDQYRSNLKEIILRSSNYKYCPRERTEIGCAKYVSWNADNSAILIVGNTIDDYYTFFNLKATREYVFWYPAESLDEEVLGSDLRLLWTINCIRSTTVSKIYIYSHVLTSASLGPIHKRLQSENKHAECVVLDSLSQISDSNAILYERENSVSDEIVQFTKRLSNNLLQPIKPKFLHTGRNNRTYWVTEFYIKNLCLPQRPQFADKVLVVRGYDSDESRVTRKGFALMCPSHTNLGIDFDAGIPRPRIQLRDGLEILKELIDEEGFDASLSDKGLFQKYLIEIFGSLNEFGEFLSDSKNRSVVDLACHMAKEKSDDPVGVFLGKAYPRILDFGSISNILGCEETTVKFLDRLTTNTFFSRGLIFQCPICRNSDWYALSEVDKSFTCKRCYTNNRLKSTHWKYPNEPKWYYRLNEVAFQAFKNNSTPVVLTLLRLHGDAEHSFIYCPEIEILKEGAPIAEIDICCFVDGKVVIGEVTTAKKKSKRQLSKLKEVARLIKPNRIVMSTTEAEWANPEQMMSYLQNKNCTLDILTMADLVLEEK